MKKFIPIILASSIFFTSIVPIGVYGNEIATIFLDSFNSIINVLDNVTEGIEGAIKNVLEKL